MDPEKIVMAVITAVVTAVPVLWKMWHDKKKTKEAAEERLESDTVRLTKQLEVVADRLAKEYTRSLEEREQKEKEDRQLSAQKSSVEFLVAVNREITHKTRRIVINFNAMRSYVIHFSNGTVTEANLHLLKVTFLHESVMDWTDRRVDLVSKSFKEANIPDMFLSPMFRLIKEGEFYLKDVNTLDVTNANSRDYHDWLRAYHVGSVLWLPIRTNEGKMVAVLVVHWPVPTDLAGTIIAKIKDVNRMIEQVYDEFKPHEPH